MSEGTAAALVLAESAGSPALAQEPRGKPAQPDSQVAAEMAGRAEAAARAQRLVLKSTVFFCLVLTVASGGPEATVVPRGTGA